MQSQLQMSEPLAGGSVRNASSSQDVATLLTGGTGKRSGGEEPNIEIQQLPMTRKGGRTALMFDRMDANSNGVLTRAELISYRLAPLVTEHPVPVATEESHRQGGKAAEALIFEQSETAGDEDVPAMIGPKSTASPDADAQIGLPKAPSAPEIKAPAPQVAAGGPKPASMPESIVVALNTAPAPAMPDFVAA